MFRGQPEEGAGLFPFGGGVAGCEETEVTDADKTVGKDVEEKAADKFLSRQTDKPVGAGLKVVAGAEGNRVSIKGDNAPVGDGGAVGVMAEVCEDMLGAEEGMFGIGIPFNSSQVADQPFEGGRFLKVLDAPGEAKISVVESLLEAVEEFAPEQFCQGTDRHEEVVFCRDPSGAIRVESTGGDDDMKVNVRGQFLVPCVKDGGEAGQRFQSRPTPGQQEQSLGGGFKEQVIKDALVSDEQRV